MATTIRWDGNASGMPLPGPGCNGVWNGCVRVIGIKNTLDASGYLGWVEVETSITNEKGGEDAGTPVRVNPGLIVLPGPSRLKYGGGAGGGNISIEGTHCRPAPIEGHRLTQYINATVRPAPGDPITVPVGASDLKVPIGDQYILKDSAGTIIADMIVSAGDVISVEGASILEVHSASLPLQLIWLIRW